MRMQLVIFDLDDTLIDFASTRQTAYAQMGKLLEQEGIDAQAYLQACPPVDRALFALFEQGKLTRAEYRARRFREPFDTLGVVASDELVIRLNTLFMDVVNDTPLLYDDVLPVLARLRERGIRTAILTNGPSDGQRRKLKATGLAERVDHVAIGEEQGFSKPLPQAFHSVVGRFGVDSGQALMVGDSPLLDYDAALNAGLRALLLDRGGCHAEGSRASIRSLDAVLLFGGDQ
jgi:putative hydrolase of the HAD superfamily